jgi:Domain of Unknown Function (DUF1080)
MSTSKAHNYIKTSQARRGKAGAVLAVLIGIVLNLSAGGTRAADSPPMEAKPMPPITGYQMRYRLADGYENWPADKREAIVKAMDEAIGLYNQLGEFPKNVRAAYSAGTPSADGNYNGNISFGGQIGFRVALHELGHVLGVGQHPKWWSLIKDKKWTGPYAIAQLRAFDGPDAVLNVDGQHFWPYGMNYDSEYTPENARRHVLLVAAFRRDLGIKSGEPLQGMIGVGTWATQAEFKDIKVTKGDQTLFASDFSKGAAALQGWKTPRGQWEVVNGALRQTSNEQGARAVVGEPSWSDYTLTLKARKLGGAEGFLVFFGLPDEDAKSQFNLGGWDNSQHGIEVPDGSIAQVPGHIETGRWYDIRVEVKGPTAKGYLDDKLVLETAR